MSKKTFTNLGRGKNPETKMENINKKLSANGREKLSKYTNGEHEIRSVQDMQEVQSVIDNEPQLSITEKQDIIKTFKKEFIRNFNFDNCPEDYQVLKEEARFLAGVTQYSFLLMAQRLKKIRDEELYRQDNYPDFKTFIEKEMTVTRQTAYKYIDIVNFFGVATLRHEDVNVSKLIPIIPILKSNALSSDRKQKIKDEYVNKSKISSARDIAKEVMQIKQELGITKNNEKIYKKTVIKKVADLNAVLSKFENEYDKDLFGMIEIVKQKIDNYYSMHKETHNG